MISVVAPRLRVMMTVVAILLVVAVMMTMIAGTLDATMTVMVVVVIATTVRVSPVMIIPPHVVSIVTRPVVVMIATLARTAAPLGTPGIPATQSVNLVTPVLLLRNLLPPLLAVKAVAEAMVGIAMTRATIAATGDKLTLRD